MDVRTAVSAVACLGHLTFAILAWQYRRQSRLAPVLALLVLDVFAWTFAAIARELTGAREWVLFDRVFSSFTPALALHVVVLFVGKTRALLGVTRAAYALSAGLALGATFQELWATLLFAMGMLTLIGSVALLTRHRARTLAAEERRRTDLVLAALTLGTLLASTELVAPVSSVPRLGSIGTFLAVALFAVGTLRLSLLGPEVTRTLGVPALVVAGIGVAFGLLALHRLDARTGFWSLLIVASALATIAVLRELRHASLLARERQRRFLLAGRFSAQLAHDLRNPLAALKGSIEFLEREHQDGRSLDAQTRFLALMSAQVDRVTRVVEKYQRMTALEPAFAPLHLNEIVEALCLPEAAPGNGRTRVALDLASDLPACALDRDLVSAALDNLLTNAYEAMPSGGVLTVRTRSTGAAVKLSVEDTGVGMDARVVEQATAEFFTTKSAGTGLGLSFVSEVARAHGGALQLTSHPGKGTLAELSFPLTRGQPEQTRTA